MKKAKHGKRAAEKRRNGRKRKTISRTTAKRKGPKHRSVKTKAAPKAKSAPLTVDAYFAALPEPARKAMSQIREAIRSVVPPEASEIISYRIPAFKHKKVLVWYAAFSSHCSLFPTAAVIQAFKDELKPFSTSKGTIHFPLDKPMQVDLIKKLVQARVTDIGK